MRERAGQQLPPIPDRPADAHKGTFGTVIVVGGSATMIGAPALCASAALRAGAGLVKIAAKPDVLPHAIVIEPGATGIALGDLRAALDETDPGAKAVLAVGPGLGQSPEAAQWVKYLLRQPRAMVLDADGLNLLTRMGKARPEGGVSPDRLVLTPHPGEFSRLAAALKITLSPTDADERPRAAAALASAHRAVVVLKGRHSVIADGRRTTVNRTGNPALATAGTGDVLTGVIASLMAQGMTGYDAAVLGAHLHGLAADLWARSNGPVGLTARDLASLIPKAIAEQRKRERTPKRKGARKSRR